ncbi:MAG: C4-dicarboxylate ABC transporter substrate-binding protein [Oscillospiraceae bacterium]|nr:MAG: C4-dicarboxylate ABC transporter substrate-binding protein [Oscillospiraceae bacterium]
MKKYLAIMMALALVLALAACGGSSAPASSAPAASSDAASPAASPAADKLKVTLVTGGTSGTYYAVGGAMQSVLNSKLGLSEFTVESTGASKANVNLITDGEAEMAIVQSDVISYAHTGTNTFEETGVEDSALWVAGLYNETVQIIATKDITDISQLKGKTVCMGDVGSGTRVNAEQVLAAYGMTADDVNAVSGSFQDGVDGIKDGKIDAAFTVAGAPTTAITDLATTNEFNMLSLTDEALAYIQENFPFLVQDNLPAGTYNGIDQETRCVAVQAALVASKDVSEDVVYELLKTMFDNKEELVKAHAKFEFLDAEYAVSGASVPLHPGAEKFYKEMGVL